jgi:hypothetical protein
MWCMIEEMVIKQRINDYNFKASIHAPLLWLR